MDFMAGGQAEWRNEADRRIAQMDDRYSMTGAIGKVRWKTIVGRWMKQINGGDWFAEVSRRYEGGMNEGPWISYGQIRR